MDECDGETCVSEGGGGPSRPRPKRPTIIRPASKAIPAEPPPRPASRPNTVISPNSSQKSGERLPGKKKLEITVIDAKPMSELGFRDIKVSASNPPVSLPACNNQPSDDSLKLKNHSEGGQDPTIGSQQVDKDDSGISQKPCAPPKARKPTIIRPGSRTQAVAGEEKPSPAPPPRPVSTPRSDLSSLKVSSVQEVQSTPQQPAQAEPGFMESSRAPLTNDRSTGQSSTSHQPPKRPPRLPSSGVPAHKITANHQTESAKLATTSGIQAYPVESKSPVLLQDAPVDHVKNKGHDTEILETKPTMLKPKPVPKPRPASVVSPGFKPDVNSENNINHGINTQSHPPGQTIQTKSHGTQEVVSPKSEWSPTAATDSVDQDEKGSSASRPVKKLLSSTENAQRPESVSSTEKVVKQESVDHARIVSSFDQRSNPPAVRPQTHKSPPAVPPAPLSSGSAGSKPPPTVIRKIDTSANANPHVDYKSASPALPKQPPARPTSAAPVKGKTTAASEKIPATPESISSSVSMKKIDASKSSQPSRLQQKTAGPPPLPKRPGPGHMLYHYMSRQPHGIALHDYTATQPDELSFSEGDTVVLVREVDEQWMIGTVGDNEGMYPTAFVEVRCPLSKEKSHDLIGSWPSTSQEHQDNVVSGPRCKARFDFEGDSEGELTLQDGDVVQITERVGTEWLRGQHRGRQGIFPSSFVEIVEDLPPDSMTDSHTISNRVSAIFDFDGKDGELNFKAGDQVTVTSQVNSEWLYGHCHGRTGQFPASFVSHIPPNLTQYEPDHSTHSKPNQTQPSGQVKHTKEGPQDSMVPGDEFWESREDVLGYCRAMFDFTDPSPGDLEFRKGDRIEIVEFFGEDWARGRLGRKEGMFPLRFVAEEVNSPPRTPEPEVVKKVFGKVLHDFDGETPDDLVIKEGDLIEVEDFADVNKNWRWGTLHGKRGMFPTDFVEILE